MSMARPTIYTDELGKKICKRIADGESARSIGRDEDMPDASTIFDWALNVNHAFSQQYTKARAIQAEHLFETLEEIADDGSNDWIERNDPENPGYQFNGEHYQRSRLRIDTKKWYLSKVLPKKFGDKVDITSGGEKMQDLTRIEFVSHDPKSK